MQGNKTCYLKYIDRLLGHRKNHYTTTENQPETDNFESVTFLNQGQRSWIQSYTVGVSSVTTYTLCSPSLSASNAWMAILGARVIQWDCLSWSFSMKLSAGINTGLGCQGFHFPDLMESIRAQPPLGNLPEPSSLRLPQVIQVTPPCRSDTGSLASGWGK